MRRLTGLGLSLLLAGTIVANAESLTLIVESAGAGVDQSSGSPVVSIKLRSSSGAAFAKFTADRIGEQIELKIDGKTVTSPIIRDAIYGGQLQISGDYTLQQATELADKIKSGSVIVEVAGSDK
jgi:preprotein translocase subunit SecD